MSSGPDTLANDVFTLGGTSARKGNVREGRVAHDQGRFERANPPRVRALQRDIVQQQVRIGQNDHRVATVPVFEHRMRDAVVLSRTGELHSAPVSLARDAGKTNWSVPGPLGKKLAVHGKADVGREEQGRAGLDGHLRTGRDGRVGGNAIGSLFGGENCGEYARGNLGSRRARFVPDFGAPALDYVTSTVGAVEDLDHNSIDARIQRHALDRPCARPLRPIGKLPAHQNRPGVGRVGLTAEICRGVGGLRVAGDHRQIAGDAEADRDLAEHAVDPSGDEALHLRKLRLRHPTAP